jgi:putative transposase
MDSCIVGAGIADTNIVSTHSAIAIAGITIVCREHRFDDSELVPKRGDGTWHDFVQRHVKSLWACDFFTTPVWTLRGGVHYYVLFVIHIGTRRVHVAGTTSNPDSVWMAQQARNLCQFFEEQRECRPTHIIRDRDGKVTPQFCGILESEGVQFRKISTRAPNMNPFTETWVQRIKRECLDHVLVLGEQHLRHLIGEYLAHIHEERPHQGLGNRPPAQSQPAPAAVSISTEEITCHQRLGGLPRHYQHRTAA